MAKQQNKNNESRSEEIAATAKVQKEEDATDYPSAGEAEANVAPKLTGRTHDAEIEDPRDYAVEADIVNAEAAIEAAASEYVAPDQPLDEHPPQKTGRKKANRSEAARGPAPTQKTDSTRQHGMA